VNTSRVVYRVHALQRMFERNVSVQNVARALASGETIEDYSDEMPEPGRLILGFQGKHPFHMVTSENPEANETTIITVYIPDSAKWDRAFKSRRR
jgi:hypothetical protein